MIIFENYKLNNYFKLKIVTKTKSVKILVKSIFFLALLNLSTPASATKKDKFERYVDTYFAYLLKDLEKKIDYELVVHQNNIKKSSKDGELQFEHEKNLEISEIISTKIANKKDKSDIELFTIQVYSGKNRHMSFAVLNRIKLLTGNAYISYKNSFYTVRVGFAASKQELLADYINISKILPNISIWRVCLQKSELSILLNYLEF